MANPKKYSAKDQERIISEICERVINGEKLSSVIKDKNYPVRSTIDMWCNNNQALSIKYVQAREAHAFNIGVFQMDEVIDEVRSVKIDPAQARVIIDALKWQASKFYPKMFGDKLDVTSDNKKLDTTPSITIIHNDEKIDLSSD